MLKITKMLTVLVAVSALAISATTAMGASVNWDGGGNDANADGIADGPNTNWGDILGGSGDGWGNWDGDVGTVGYGDNLNLKIASTTTTCDVDVSQAPWVNSGGPGGTDIQNTNTVLIPAGGVFYCKNMYARVGGNSTLKLTGGEVRIFHGEGAIYSNADSYIELSDGNWSDGRMRQPKEVWVRGAGATLTPDGFDTLALDGGTTGTCTTSFKWTLEPNEGISTMALTGVLPAHNGAGADNYIMFGAHKKELGSLFHPAAGVIPVEVGGIQDYLAAGGLQMTWDLITLPAGETDQDLDCFYTGPVDGGWGTVSVKTGSGNIGLQLDLIPEPGTLVLLGLGGLGLVLRRKRR